MTTTIPLWQRLKDEFPKWKFSSGTRLGEGFIATMPNKQSFTAGPFDTSDELCEYLHMRADTLELENAHWKRTLS